MKRHRFEETNPNLGRAYKKTTTTMNTTRPLTLAQSQAVSREVNKQMARKADYKRTNSKNNGTAIDYGGLVYDLFGSLVRGDGMENNFEGSSIQPRSIRIRGQCQMSSSDVYNTIRCVVFQWGESGTPTPNGLYDYSSTPLAVQGTKYWTNKRNIKVLADRTYQMDVNENQAQDFEIYVKGFKLKQVWFSTTSNAPQNNGIFMYLISDSAAIPHPAVKWTSEIVFTD